MNHTNSQNTPPTSQPYQRKLLHVYKRAQKELYNEREFQLIIKKYIKTLTSIKCQEFRMTMANLFFTDIDEIQLSQFKSLIKILKRNKYLRALKLPNQSPRTFSINIILPHLKNLRALSNFTLELADTQRITPKICHSFALSIKNLKQLTHLNHNIYQDLQNPWKSLKTFRHFPMLQHLNNLSLSFRFTKTFTDQSFIQFSYHLSHLQSLTSLTLNLDNCGGLTKVGLSHLFSSLSKLSLLAAFSFKSYGFQNLTSHLLIKLFQSLRNLSSLQELALSLSACGISKVSEQQEPLAAGLSLINPSSLRRISLDFYSTFSDSDLSNLFLVLQRFKSLTHFKLGFYQISQMTGQGLSNLHETLRHFPSLTHFSLMESSRMDANLVLNSLSLSIGNLKHLQSLKLMIYSNDSLSNLAIQTFSTKLSELSGLRYLDLDFEECQKLSDRSLESLAAVLRELENLESLHLNFEMIDKVTNQGVIALGSSLAHLKHLKDLKLKLGNNENGESLESLTTSLKCLDRLNEIYLNFGGSSEDGSSSENYKDFIGIVERLDSLRKIFLIMPQFEENKYCDEIAEKASSSSKDFTIFWK